MKNVKIATFLKERKIKLKPDEANNSNLKRIEKIDFAGNITMVPTKTKTDMILVKKGDLVISGINVEKGALTIYQGEEDVLASIHYSAYEFDETQIYILYLKYFLKSREFRKLLIEQSGSGIKNEIKAKHILPLEIKLPSMQEQHRIVERIQAVENDIVELDKEVMQQYEYCKNLRQSILQQAVEGNLCEQNPDDEPASILLERIKKEKDKLVQEGKIKKTKELSPISDKEKPFELPQGWEWCRFDEIANIASNLVAPEKYLDYMHIAPDNIEKNTARLHFCYTVKDNDVKSFNHLFNKGQIIYSKIRPALRKVVLAPFNGLCSADMYPIDALCVPKYLLYYMLTDCFTVQVTMNDNRVKMPKTNQSELLKVFVALPPLQEQQRIVEKVDGLMLLCDELEKEVDAAQQYASQLMEAVLQEAFSTDKSIEGEQLKQKCEVIPFRQKQKEVLWFAMAARGKIKQSTLESLQKRAIEIANGEK